MAARLCVVKMYFLCPSPLFFIPSHFMLCVLIDFAVFFVMFVYVIARDVRSMCQVCDFSDAIIK